MSFPALDLAGYQLRSKLPEVYSAGIEQKYPGFVDAQLELETSTAYARLRKRYGRGPSGSGIPFGSQPAQFDVSGTNPPGVVLSGVPIVGCNKLAIRISTPGALGTALFDWSTNGGRSYPQIGVATAALVVLAGTGITAAFSQGTYSTDNFYRAPAPVPEVLLGWICALVDFAVMDRRGYDPSDRGSERVIARYEKAQKDLQEAADGNSGLLDLPTNDNGDSGISSGGPLVYTEQSPYVWTDQQAAAATQQDRAGAGTVFG